MRIVMLSRDASGLSPASATAGRWRALRAEGIELRAIVMAREGRGWSEPGLDVVAAVSPSLPMRLIRAWRALRRLVSGADLVTAQDPFELGAMAWTAARLAHIPFEIQDHGGFFDGGDVDEPLWPLRRRLAWFLARRADAVRTVGPLSLDALKRHGDLAEPYLLPIGADPRFAKIERHPEPGLVVSVGRLVSVKRMEILIEAIGIRCRANPSAKLVLVGDGPERPRLEALAGRVAPGAVDFVGAGDPAPWLARASVFCLASRHEGWGIAAVEAAMAGVPVLMSDTGCARWLTERGAAKIVASADPAAWAAAMADPAPAAGHATLEYPQGPAAQTAAWKRIASGKKS